MAKNLLIGLPLVVALSGVAGAATYSGSLTYGPPLDVSDGLIADGAVWGGGTVTLSWTVTDTDNSQPGFPWKYSYTLETPGPSAEISHMIVGVSDTFDDDDYTALTGETDEQEVGDFSEGNGNPNMPATGLRGLKFDEAGGTTLTVTFFSTRAPVWEDFYAKCGNVGGDANTVYNAGFADANPDDPPADGSLDGHLLAPDSVPEPATLAVMVLGAAGAALHRRRGLGTTTK